MRGRSTLLPVSHSVRCAPPATFLYQGKQRVVLVLPGAITLLTVNRSVPFARRELSILSAGAHWLHHATTALLELTTRSLAATLRQLAPYAARGRSTLLPVNHLAPCAARGRSTLLPVSHSVRCAPPATFLYQGKQRVVLVLPGAITLLSVNRSVPFARRELSILSAGAHCLHHARTALPELTTRSLAVTLRQLAPYAARGRSTLLPVSHSVRCAPPATFLYQGKQRVVLVLPGAITLLSVNRSVPFARRELSILSEGAHWLHHARTALLELTTRSLAATLRQLAPYAARGRSALLPVNQLAPFAALGRSALLPVNHLAPYAARGRSTLILAS